MKIAIRLVFLCLLLVAQISLAQDNNYDALAKTFSQLAPTGSARFQAIGGNHAALGADVSSASGNPAGLGFYTRSEFSFTPAYQSMSNKSVYAIEPTKTTNANQNNFNIANIGVIFGGGKPQYKDQWRGSWGITYSRQNTLYNNIQFSGKDAASSITDSYAEGLNGSNLTTQNLTDDLNQNAPFFNNTYSMYYWGYLVTPTSNTTNPFIGAEPQSKVNQSFDFQSTGRISQWSIAYGGTANEKLYLGFSLGIPSFKYETIKNFSETYQTYQEIKGFTDSRTLTSSGSGINLSVGGIYRPNETIRLGLNITTPTWYDIDETASASVKVDVDAAKGIDIGTNPNSNILSRLGSLGYKIEKRTSNYFITSIPRLSTNAYSDNYQLRTPFKANAGIAAFFGKKGFISADVEYIAYSGMSLSTTSTDVYLRDDLNYYTNTIKQQYDDVFNLKLGGEYRAGIVGLRAGISYYADPYKKVLSSTNTTNTIDHSQLIYSAGIGVKTNEFYIDFTGMYAGSSQSAYTPYTLSNTSEFASAKINSSYVKGLVTFGIYF